jgi:hypothetical protein
MAVKAGRSHEFSITNVSGEEMGFICKKIGNTDHLDYKEGGARSANETIHIGSPDYGMLPAQEELWVGQWDWRMGFGLLFASEVADEVKRYYQTINADASLRGQIMPAPVAGTIAIPSIGAKSFTITNADCEADSAWEGDGARSATQAHGGTYSWKLDEQDDEMYQDLSWSTDYQGAIIILRAYAYDSQNKTRLYINDGVSTTYGAYTDGGGAWTEITCQKRLSLNATQLRIGAVYNGSTAGDGYLDDFSIDSIGASGAPVAHTEFDGSLYIGFGAWLHTLNSSADGWTKMGAFPQAITYLKPFTESGVDYMFIGQGAGNNPWTLSAESLDACEYAWDDMVDTDVTVSTDHSTYHNGTASVKLAVGADCAAGDTLAGKAISSKDFTGYHFVKFWFRSSTALDAGDLQFGIDETADFASPDILYDIPAISADTWTECTIDLGDDDLADMDAVLSYGLKMVTDKGAFNCWIDQIKLLTFEENTQTNNDAILYAKITSSSGEALYHSDNPNLIYKNTTPYSASWGNPIYVGEGGYNITSVFNNGDTVFICREDEPYYLDASDIPHTVNSVFRTMIGANNGKNSKSWNGRSYFLTGTPNIFEYDRQGNLLNISPSLFTQNDTTFDGDVQAIAGDEAYIFAAVDNSTKLEILKGGWELVDGYDDWRWHPFCEVTLTGAEAMFVSSIGDKKRLYIFSTSSSDSVVYIPLPESYGNVGGDANMTFQTGGYLITPWEDANLKDDDKAWFEIYVYLQDCDASNYFTIYYQKWGDADWTKIDDFGDGEETYQSAVIPVDGSSNKPVSKRMRFKISITCETDTCPILLGYAVRGAWYPDKRYIYQARVVLADNKVKSPGTDRWQTASAMRTFLKGCYRPSTVWPVTLSPIGYVDSDDDVTVRLIEPFEITPVSIEHPAPDVEKITYEALLTMVEMDTS